MTRRAVGLDGCAAGWVAVTLHDGEVQDVEVVDDLRVVLEGDTPPDAVAVDMPIGLVDGRRDADVAARLLLPNRASSVFSTPPATVVDTWRKGGLADHAAASALAREVTGSGISQQAWRLVPRIAEIDDLIASGHHLLETHPEVAFAVVVGEPLPRKRSWAGLTTRRAVLERLGIVLPSRFLGDALAAADDVLDAAVCAWVADGAASGQPLLQLPDHTEQRAHGREITMVVRAPSDLPPGVPRPA